MRENAKGDEISCRDLKETPSIKAFIRKQFSPAVPPSKANQRASALLIKSHVGCLPYAIIRKASRWLGEGVMESYTYLS